MSWTWSSHPVRHTCGIHQLNVLRGDSDCNRMVLEVHCGLICILFLSQSCGIISQSITSRSNYDCGFFTVQFVRVPFSIGVHVHVVNKAAETQSTDRSAQSNRKTVVHKEIYRYYSYLYNHATSIIWDVFISNSTSPQSHWVTGCVTVEICIASTCSTWHLSVFPACRCPALVERCALIIVQRLTRHSSGSQRFVPLVMGCITLQHMVWTQVGQLSRKHACWWIRDDVLNGDMESAYVTAEEGHLLYLQ